MAASVPPDPVELIQAARSGDPQALGRLLELYRNYLRLLARLQFGHRFHRMPHTMAYTISSAS
jgi:hypothetical protein